MLTRSRTRGRTGSRWKRRVPRYESGLVDNAFCPGEGARDNSCSPSNKGSGDKSEVTKMIEKAEELAKKTGVTPDWLKKPAVYPSTRFVAHKGKKFTQTAVNWRKVEPATNPGRLKAIHDAWSAGKDAASGYISWDDLAKATGLSVLDIASEVKSYDSGGTKTSQSVNRKGDGVYFKFKGSLAENFAGAVEPSPKSGAMIALRIPDDIARDIWYAGGERVADLHITLVYVRGDDLDPEATEKLKEVYETWRLTRDSVNATLTRLRTFFPSENSDGKWVLYAEVESSDLEQARALLTDLLDEAGIKYSQDFKYHPHVTLAYFDEQQAYLPPFKRITFEASESILTLPIATEKAASPTTNRLRPNPLRIDPTRTADIRRAFNAEIERRFDALRGEVRNLETTANAFCPGEGARDNSCSSASGGLSGALKVAEEVFPEPKAAIDAWNTILRHVESFKDDESLNKWWRSTRLGNDAAWKTKDDLASFARWKIDDITGNAFCPGEGARDNSCPPANKSDAALEKVTHGQKVKFVGEFNPFFPSLKPGDVVEIFGEQMRAGGELGAQVKTAAGKIEMVMLKDLRDPTANAFCPGEGARDNSCPPSNKGGGKLSTEEEQAVHDFTLDSGEVNAGDIREYQRTGKGSEAVVKATESLKAAVDKLPSVEGKVYRGIPFSKRSGRAFLVTKIRRAREYVEDAFASASTDRVTAEEFSSGTFPVILSIDSKTAKDISSYSVEPAQKEALLLPGTRYEFIREERGPYDTVILHMREKPTTNAFCPGEGPRDNSCPPANKGDVSESTTETDERGIRDGGGVRGGASGMEPSSGPADITQPLRGAPTTAKIAGRTVQVRPSARIRQLAADYCKAAGIDYQPPQEYVKVDKERAREIASEFDKMKDDPNDPEVRAAYQAMANETIAQYEVIMKSGLKVDFIDYDKDGDPYSVSPRLAIEDIQKNNHFSVFPTSAGFGTGTTSADFDASTNPLLQPTKYMISGRMALVNDLFRVVHDYFGHAKEGNGMRADGEENAWRSHSAMYSPQARRAMTSETRGQNSWVNFGPKAEHNKHASGADTVYADQKVGLLPQWVVDEGSGRGGTIGNTENYDPDQPRDDQGQWTSTGAGVAKELFKRVKEDNGFTYQPERANTPSVGSSVSDRPLDEEVFNSAKVTEQDIYNYLKKHAKEFDDPERHIGGWHDKETGRVVLDLVRVVSTHEEADQIAIEARQDGYFDLKTKELIIVDREAASKRRTAKTENEGTSNTWEANWNLRRGATGSSQADLRADPGTALILNAFCPGEGPRDNSCSPSNKGEGKTDSPEFKSWFGDSKAVDKDGKPLVVYHGTSAKFVDEFDPMRGEVGAHFGTKEIASGIAEAPNAAGRGNRVIPVYLSIKNPLVMKDPGSWDLVHLTNTLVEKGDMTGAERDKWMEDFQSRWKAHDFKRPYPRNRDIHELLESHGYDGIQYINRREGIDLPKDLKESSSKLLALSDKEFLERVPSATTSWIALKPTQIKSAISSKFDPKDPIITHAERSRFNTLLDRTLNRGWWEEFIERGYNRGLDRSFGDVERPALITGNLRRADEVRISRVVFNSKAREKREILVNGVAEKFSGLSSRASARVRREVERGIDRDRTPDEITDSILNQVDMAEWEARRIAQTELTRSQAEGQLDAFEELGEDDIEVLAEWEVGDHPCELCESMDGVVMDLEEARGLIPRHPNCMCSYRLAGRSRRGQKRGDRAYEAIRRSLLAGPEEDQWDELVDEDLLDDEDELEDDEDFTDNLAEFSAAINAFCPGEGPRDNSCPPSNKGAGGFGGGPRDEMSIRSEETRGKASGAKSDIRTWEQLPPYTPTMETQRVADELGLKPVWKTTPGNWTSQMVEGRDIIGMSPRHHGDTGTELHELGHLYYQSRLSQEGKDGVKRLEKWARTLPVWGKGKIQNPERHLRELPNGEILNIAHGEHKSHEEIFTQLFSLRHQGKLTGDTAKAMDMLLDQKSKFVVSNAFCPGEGPRDNSCYYPRGGTGSETSDFVQFWTFGKEGVVAGSDKTVMKPSEKVQKELASARPTSEVTVLYRSHREGTPHSDFESWTKSKEFAQHLTEYQGEGEKRVTLQRRVNRSEILFDTDHLPEHMKESALPTNEVVIAHGRHARKMAEVRGEKYSRGQQTNGDIVSNAYCATGPGGGEDNSCGYPHGGGTAVAEGASSKSGAEVQLSSYLDDRELDRVANTLQDLYPHAKDEVAALTELASSVGAPDNAIVKVRGVLRRGDVYGIGVHVTGTDPAFEAQRFIGIDEKGNKFVENEHIEIASKGRGLGTEIFTNQVLALADQGFSYIKTEAGGEAGHKVYNGYYTWPLLGYNQSITDKTIGPGYQDVYKEAAKRFDAETILDVYQTKEGRDWWKANGKPLPEMVFDLSPDSRSIEVLSAYVETKNEKRATRRSTSTTTNRLTSTPLGTRSRRNESASEWTDIVNAFCPGEGPRDNTCPPANKGGGEGEVGAPHTPAPGQMTLPFGKSDQETIKLEQRASRDVSRAEKSLDSIIGTEIQTVQTWEELDDDVKSEAENEWTQQHYDEYIDDSWRDEAADELRGEIQSEVAKDEDFIKRQVDEWAENMQIKLPEGEALSEYIDIDWNGAVSLNDKAYDKFGLTIEQAKSIEDHVEDVVTARVDRLLEDQIQDLEMPDHVMEDAMSAANEAFNELPDSEKLEMAGVSGTTTIEEPNEYKIVKDGDDYDKTRAVALGLQRELTTQFAKERGLNISNAEASEMAQLLWSEWKSSSTSDHGLLLQWAAAEELGGLKQEFTEAQEERIKSAALDLYEGDAKKGLEAAKVHVAATWAATQYIMQKAGIKEVPLYRAIMVDGSKLEKEQKEVIHLPPEEYHGERFYTKVPSVQINRNGAASTATGDEGLRTANSWQGVGGTKELTNPQRIVLRIKAPREAYVSVPAFGQNVAEEQEVVLAGTQNWDGWDAWHVRAPSFEEVPCCK